jgi:hypothetical protein
VVVDLGVGEVAAFLAQGDQGLEPRAADFRLFSRGASAIIGASLSLTFAARGLAGALRGVLGFSVVMVVLDWSSELLSVGLGERISRNRKLYYESVLLCGL